MKKPRKTVNFRISADTFEVFEKLVQKYKKHFSYHFTKTDIIEIAILRLADKDVITNIKKLYNQYLKHKKRID
jgi:hypothetical protein